MAPHGLTNGLRQHVCDQCLRQTFRTAYETQGKSYDKMEFIMQVQYYTSNGDFRTLLIWLSNRGFSIWIPWKNPLKKSCLVNSPRSTAEKLRPSIRSRHQLRDLPVREAARLGLFGESPRSAKHGWAEAEENAIFSMGKSWKTIYHMS